MEMARLFGLGREHRDLSRIIRQMELPVEGGGGGSLHFAADMMRLISLIFSEGDASTDAWVV